jgi:hypothetical protein
MRHFGDKISIVIDPHDRSTITYIYAVKRAYKHYFNSTHQFARITKSERLYFDYLCEKMDVQKNLITIDNQLNKDFCKLLEAWTSGKSKVSVKSIPKFISHLVAVNLIHPYRTSKRELYQVNPKYAFKGNDLSRKKLFNDEIRYNIKNSLPFAHLIDCSEEEFRKRLMPL